MSEKERPRPTGQGGNGADTQSVRSDAYHHEGPGGYFVVPRGWRGDPVFQDQPFSEREAWLWLLENAAWKDQCRRLKQFTVPENRGQVAASSRYLADAWKWPEPRVRRFRDRLIKAGKISVAGAAAGVGVVEALGSGVS